MTHKRPPARIVRWRDALLHTNRFVSAEEVADAPILEARGYLVSEDLTTVALALEWDANDNTFRCVLKIPHECIVEQRQCKLGKKIE